MNEDNGDIKMYRMYKQAINAETIAAMNQSVENEADGNTFEMFIPPVSCNILDRFKDSLFTQCSKVKWDDSSFVAIRSVTNGGKEGAQGWHFDNFGETTLIVLKSFEGEHNGDILVRANLRKRPTSKFLTVISKLFWTNPITWIILRQPYLRNKFFTRLTLKAGDVLVFEGSTTYHGNLPVDVGTRRTILIHEEPVFEDALFTKFFDAICKIFYYKS